MHCSLRMRFSFGLEDASGSIFHASLGSQALLSPDEPSLDSDGASFSFG